MTERFCEQQHLGEVMHQTVAWRIDTSEDALQVSVLVMD